MAAMASMTSMKSSVVFMCGGGQIRSPHVKRMPLRNLRFYCKAQADSETKDIPSDSTSSIPSAAPLPTKKVSAKFGDVFAFSGPAPETINGRLAMVGFVSAVGVELASGHDLVTQLSNGGVLWFVIMAGLLSAASLVPLFKGVSAESKSQSLFSSSAEMLNGRMAMIGLAALAVTEFVKGGPLV